jgi:hypothetical protein
MAGKTANLAAEILSMAVTVIIFSLFGAGVGFGLYLRSKKK